MQRHAERWSGPWCWASFQVVTQTPVDFADRSFYILKPLFEPGQVAGSWLDKHNRAQEKHVLFSNDSIARRSRLSVLAFESKFAARLTGGTTSVTLFGRCFSNAHHLMQERCVHVIFLSDMARKQQGCGGVSTGEDCSHSATPPYVAPIVLCWYP